MNNTKSWQTLMDHQQQFSLPIPELFAQNENRFKEFSLNVGGLLFDYSKQHVTEETLQLLCGLAEESLLAKYRDDLFSGEKLNHSEARSVLHTALRDLSDLPLQLENKNIKLDISAVLKRLETFEEGVRNQKIKGATSLPFTDIICLGIGGSELGPRLLIDALTSYKVSKLNFHFLSNIDAHSLSKILKTLNPLQTLCIISSKTFTTLETLQNADVIKSWFSDNIGLQQRVHEERADQKRIDQSINQKQIAQERVAQHFVAVTAYPDRAQAFGIKPEHIFEFWEWVGGRFSIWSAVGLPAILAVGMNNFKEFLSGAYEMDTHFYSAPLRQNMPVLMGLLGIWNNNALGYTAQAIIPYDDKLHSLPNYLQQLEMESNGKSTDKSGKQLSYPTAPIIWGGVGCNSQHAFMQLLHQGTQVVPVDFLIGINGETEFSQHQKLLIANCFGQSKALMEGWKPNSSTDHDSMDHGSTDSDSIDSDSNHDSMIEKLRECSGNRPSSTLIYPKLTPRILGNLLALYEHKVFVQGVIWGINSFDQWGVELGKTLAKTIYSELEIDIRDHGIPDLQNHAFDGSDFQKSGKEGSDLSIDSSTRGLIRFFQNHFVTEK